MCVDVRECAWYHGRAPQQQRVPPSPCGRHGLFRIEKGKKKAAMSWAGGDGAGHASWVQLVRASN